MQFDISTERLHLRPFQVDDQSLFLSLNQDPFIRKYLWDDEIISSALAAEIIQQNEQHFQKDQFGLWKIYRKNADEVMGYVGLWYFFEEVQPQLIYALLEAHTDHGYAKEAAQAIIQYAFRTLNYTYLIAATDEGHQASQKVARSLGMIFSEKRMEEGKPTYFYRIENE